MEIKVKWPILIALLLLPLLAFWVIYINFSQKANEGANSLLLEKLNILEEEKV